MTEVGGRALLMIMLGLGQAQGGTAAHAAEPAERAELADSLDTTLSLRTALWSGSRRLDDQSATSVVSAWGRANFKSDSLGSVSADGWIGRSSPGAEPRSRLRELYWSYQAERMQLKIGRQMNVWGRADGINPTDNLTPHDYTLLTPEDGDQRHGRDAVQADLELDAGHVFGWWSPSAAGNTVPLPALAGVRYLAPTATDTRQWALKWELNHDGIDGSLSYYHGSDLMPDMMIAGVDAQGWIVAQRNHPSRVLGADFSLSSNSVIWRAEAAYSRTDSAGPDDFNHKKPQLRLVGGPEFSFGSTTTLGLQAVWQKVSDFSSPDRVAQPLLREQAWQQSALSNQTSANQAGFTWRLASRWWNDTLLAETSGALITTDSSGVWRTKLSYALDDHWSLRAGSDAYFGPSHSFYGKLAMNRVLYAQLRYGF